MLKKGPLQGNQRVGPSHQSTKSRASILLANQGVKLDEDASLFTLKFFSLDNRALVYEIPHADSLLSFDKENNQAWVLRVLVDELTQCPKDEVTLIKWDPSEKKTSDQNVIERYVSDSYESEIAKHRFSRNSS